MSIAVETVEPARKLWSREEYYRMADLGWFQGQHTELVGGDIVVVSPQKYRHAYTLDRAGNVLRRVFGAGFWVRTQLPLQCGRTSEPEPDVSVVAGTGDDYEDHPRTALLVVEVSDTTLDFDRSQKMSLYAKSGFPEYWIINLVDRVLEVYREPEADQSQPFGARYGNVQRLIVEAIVAPLPKPDQPIAVADLMP